MMTTYEIPSNTLMSNPGKDGSDEDGLRVPWNFEKQTHAQKLGNPRCSIVQGRIGVDIPVTPKQLEKVETLTNPYQNKGYEVRPWYFQNEHLEMRGKSHVYSLHIVYTILVAQVSQLPPHPSPGVMMNMG